MRLLRLFFLLIMSGLFAAAEDGLLTKSLPQLKNLPRRSVDRSRERGDNKKDKLSTHRTNRAMHSAPDKSHNIQKGFIKNVRPHVQNILNPNAVEKKRELIRKKKGITQRSRQAAGFDENDLEEKVREEIKNAAQFDQKISQKENQQLKEAQSALIDESFMKKNNKQKKDRKFLGSDPISFAEQAIFLNFEKIKLSSFIHYVGGLKKINVVPDKATETIEISIVIREPLTIDGAWQVFLTILEMYGFSIVEIGPTGNPANIFKVIPRGAKRVEPWKSYIFLPADSLPDTDMTIRYVCSLTNIAVGDVSSLLASMLGPDSQLLPQPNINGFIITDKALNIKSAMKVINELDQSGLKEDVVVKKLNKSNALEVKALLEKLIVAPEGNTLARLLGKKAEGSLEYFSSSTKIVAVEGTNMLILLGNIKAIKTIEDFIDRYFEVTEKVVKSPFKKFRFKYAEATQMKDLLTEVINTPIDTPAGKSGGVFGGVKYFKNMNFQVDERSNTLYVTCADPLDWKMLKPTLKGLDVAQPSVVIETLIVSVDVSDNKQLGGQLRPKSRNSLGESVGFQSAALSQIIPEQVNGKNVSLLGNLLGAITGFGRGSTVLSFGNAAAGNIWAVFRALKEETNASVLSQPFVTATNRVKAISESGQTRRIVKETAVSDLGGSGDARSYTNQDAKTHIEYTPQINLDGIINLQVDATISDFGAKAEELTIKKLTTNVSIASGQVLVLGGFVKTKVTQSEHQTPFLSKIPILGWLAKNKDRNISKQYVFIFACPTIIKPRQSPGIDLYTKIKLHDAEASIDDAIDTKRTKDPIHNWFFNPDGETYSHKVVDFATARYQPTLVDLKNDPSYRVDTEYNEKKYGSSYNSLDPQKDDLFVQSERPIESIILTQDNKKVEEKVLDYSLAKERNSLKDILAPAENQEIKIDSIKEKISVKKEANDLSFKSVPLLPDDNADLVLKDSRNRLKDLLSMHQGAASYGLPRRNG